MVPEGHWTDFLNRICDFIADYGTSFFEATITHLSRFSANKDSSISLTKLPSISAVMTTKRHLTSTPKRANLFPVSPLVLSVLPWGSFLAFAPHALLTPALALLNSGNGTSSGIISSHRACILCTLFRPDPHFT